MNARGTLKESTMPVKKMAHRYLKSCLRTKIPMHHVTNSRKVMTTLNKAYAKTVLAKANCCNDVDVSVLLAVLAVLLTLAPVPVLALTATRMCKKQCNPATKAAIIMMRVPSVELMGACTERDPNKTPKHVMSVSAVADRSVVSKRVL
jgi:hypothetical protein